MSADWLSMRVEYESTQISLKDLAEKNKVSHDRIRHVASKHNWAKKKEEIEETIMQEVRENVIKERIVSQGYIIQELYNIVSDENMKTQYKLKAIEMLARTLGMFKDNVKIDAEITNRKLEDILIENELYGADRKKA